jgi:F420-non-reducing hydrogenase iron-sulfur subunit
MEENFEPKVVAFCCHYCAYSAADLAGSMRLEYSPNVRIVKLMCTGKVDTLHLLKAFEDGADAVYVAGCEEGSCHFQEGNLRAKMKVEQAKKLLKEVGIEPERLEMCHIAASNSVLFAKTADEMTERARKLGPNPLKRNKS